MSNDLNRLGHRRSRIVGTSRRLNPVWRFTFLASLLAIPFSPALGGANELAGRDAPWFPFIQRHCIGCHGPDLQEAGLRLDRLTMDLESPDAERTWIHVLDRVADGQMPPPDEPRPPENERAVFAEQLTRDLHAASLARQQREGRVALRRLNRIEHETTLRDLLGVQIDIADLLPEENTAAGFDKVSSALDISAAHLLRHQEVARRAVRAAIPTRDSTPTKIERWTGRGIAKSSRTVNSSLDTTMRLEGDTLIVYVRSSDSVPVATPWVRRPGRYRVRASMYTVGSEERPLPVLVSRRSPYSKGDTARRVRDIPSGQTVILSEEFDLDNRGMVSFSPWDLPRQREFTSRDDVRPLEKFSGPGLAIEWVELEGPLDEFPPAGYRRLFGNVPLKRRLAHDPASLWPAPLRPREEVERLIREVLPIAFRRPVDGLLTRYFVDLAHYELSIGEPFHQAMTVAYTAIFSSPHFLYLVEPLDSDLLDESGKGDNLSSGRIPLDDYAVASRLSYFLWSSTPDAELLELAEQRRLRNREVLRTQVERMLGDPKANRFTKNFAGQWLDLREINATTPDPSRYGEFDGFLFWSMPRETEAFFEEVLKHDLPITDFVHSDWTFLNQRLAQHYGIRGVAGGELRKVALPVGSRRGGVLTQAAILKVTADGSTTSPILRGTWVLERILGQLPPPPPEGIEAVEPDVRGITTIRQLLEKHRDSPACAACHRHIDPPGFALESFDPIGGWRDFYRGVSQKRVPLPNYPGRTVPRGMDVETGGQTADGRSFRDIDEYKQILLSHKDQLARNLVQKLIIYSTGAEIQFADREVVERLVAESRQSDYGFRSLIHAVTQSPLFVSK